MGVLTIISPGKIFDVVLNHDFGRKLVPTELYKESKKKLATEVTEDTELFIFSLCSMCSLWQKIGKEVQK
jgi:hypothetical protein